MKRIELKTWSLLRNGLCSLLVLGLVSCGDGVETAENEVVETAAVEEEIDTDTWDNDRFNNSFTSTGRFGGWDTNDDNMLDENEYYGSYYDTWDLNNDNYVDQDEWNNASNDFGMTGQNWADWDTNKDNRLDENEFRAGTSKNNNFGTWDRNSDRMLDEKEYSEGVFSLWDNDRDGMLNNEEYNNRYNRYYGERD